MLGDDELSQLVRELVEPSDVATSTVSQDVEAVVVALRNWLMQRGWPDPLELLILRDDEFQGETWDGEWDLRMLLEVGIGLAEPVPGWRAIREHFEQDGEALSADWGAAKLIGLALEFLHTEEEQRDRALLAFGYYMRDWMVRLDIGREARTRRKQTRDFRSDPDGLRGAYRTRRRARAEIWQQEARRIATAKWARRPDRSATEVAKEIQRALGPILQVKAPDCTIPSVARIRRVIADVKPK